MIAKILATIPKICVHKIFKNFNFSVMFLHFLFFIPPLPLPIPFPPLALSRINRKYDQIVGTGMSERFYYIYMALTFFET